MSDDIVLTWCPGFQKRTACLPPVFWSNRTPGFRRGKEPERGTSGGCFPSPANPCWVAGDRCRCSGLPVTACRHTRWAVEHGDCRDAGPRGGGRLAPQYLGRPPGSTMPPAACLALLGPGAACCPPPPDPTDSPYAAQETPTLAWCRTRRHSTMPCLCSWWRGHDTRHRHAPWSQHERAPPPPPYCCRSLGPLRRPRTPESARAAPPARTGAALGTSDHLTTAAGRA